MLESFVRTTASLFYPTLVVSLLCCLPSFVLAKSTSTDYPDVTNITVWHKNQQVASTFEFIELALAKVGLPHKINIRTIADNQRAYEALALSDAEHRLDIIVAGVSVAREQQFLPVYIPLDRGLLGFRVCMITPEEQSRFFSVNKVSDFAQQALRVSLVDSWPDVEVMMQNQIPVVTNAEYLQAAGALDTHAAECFSRSVIEIGKELQSLPQLTEEQRLALIYPFADIIYVNPNNPELHQQLLSSLLMALEDRSFYQLHDRHYQQLLENHQFYARKLLIMENTNLSDAALEAINRYGVASFSRLKRVR